MNPPPRVQFFGGKTGTVGRSETFASWRAFREYLVNAGPFPSKDACPMFSAGIFDGPIKGRIPTEFTLVVGEHDDCEVGVDEAIARLLKAGIAAFIHTSASHAPERPRWRVVAPLQQPCGSEDYLEYLNLLNGALGGCLATESGDLSRRWYYGCVEGAPYEWKVTPGGALIDNVAAGEHDIEAIPVKSPKKVSSAPANTEPRTEYDLSRAISALQAIPNSGAQHLPYEQWRDLAMGLHEGSGGDQRALDALIEWTADGQDEKTAAIWNRFTIRDGGITRATLFKAARDAGWQDPGDTSAYGFTNLNDEREELFNAAVAAGTISAEAIVTSRAAFNRCDLRTQPVLAYRLVPEDYRERFEKVLIAANAEYSTLVERLRADAREYDKWGEQQRAVANGWATAERTPPAVAAAELIKQLESEPRDKVISTWAARATHLSKTECEDVIAAVEKHTKIGRRKLAVGLNEARAALKRERAKAAFERDAAGRRVIEAEKGELGPMSAATEAAILARAKPGEYVVFGGRVSCVGDRELPFTHMIDAVDGRPPSVPVIHQLGPTDVEVKAGEAAVFVSYGTDGQQIREHVPQRVIDHLMKSPSKNVARVSGLISHPVVMPGGEIVARDGLHECSGLFLYGAEIEGLRPYTQEEAAAALARLREGLFAEFEFASDADADIALAALFTAAQRRVMDSAPGLAVLANRQSSGKTTLARMIHVAITGRDLPVTTLADDEAEMQKRLLALLLRSPEMVCIDNVPDGFTFRSASLSAAMTSGELSQRVLGTNDHVEVPTSVMFAITGNNLTLGADEVTRWMPCRLAPKGARPEERRFRAPDVVGNVLRQRQSVLRDVVGVVAGFIASGAPVPPSGTRFTTWDKVVRAPLIWAGATDVADVFRRNREESADELTQVGLLLSLRERFGEKVEFGAVEVADAVRAHDMGRTMPGDPSVRLIEALSHGKVRDIRSSKSVGRALAAVVGRVVEVDGYEIVLRKRVLRGLPLYWVEGGPPKTVDDEGPGEDLL